MECKFFWRDLQFSRAKKQKTCRALSTNDTVLHHFCRIPYAVFGNNKMCSHLFTTCSLQGSFLILRLTMSLTHTNHTQAAHQVNINWVITRCCDFSAHLTNATERDSKRSSISKHLHYKWLRMWCDETKECKFTYHQSQFAFICFLFAFLLFMLLLLFMVLLLLFKCYLLKLNVDRSRGLGRNIWPHFLLIGENKVRTFCELIKTHAHAHAHTAIMWLLLIR